MYFILRIAIFPSPYAQKPLFIMLLKTIILYRWLYIHSSKEEFYLSGGLKHYKSQIEDDNFTNWQL